MAGRWIQINFLAWLVKYLSFCLNYTVKNSSPMTKHRPNYEITVLGKARQNKTVDGEAEGGGLLFRERCPMAVLPV